MDRVVIVGSGASGVHFALSVLEKGYDVVMLDVGRVKPPVVNPRDTFNELKQNLDDPARYFLGDDYEGVVYPGSEGEYYGFPPNKSYIFASPPAFATQSSGFAALSSFAQGGLAETWTGGAYPLDDTDLGAFPFGYRDLEPFYSEVARRIGITGVADDLARFYPVHANLMEPLRLDRHSALLMERYEQQRGYLNKALGSYIGRSRVATLSADRDGRRRCTYLGRCLWGCPSGSLYTPLATLDECRRFSNFTYVPNVYVNHLRITSGRRVACAVTEPAEGGGTSEVAGDRFVLAAGTLSSSNIYLRTVLQETGETIVLGGLMDNRQVLVPFLTLAMIGERYDPDNYQYHQVALGFDPGGPQGYVHGQITTLTTALVHPIVQNMPVDLRTALSIFRNVRAGLGVVNVNLRDSRREGNCVTLSESRDARPKLVIRYTPPASEAEMMGRVLKTVRKTLWRLGCVVPPGMSHLRPMGASVHYAGTIPMSATGAP
ncbi:MAG: hypothetical protein ACRD1H_19880, partial [Vicinamibacterales bacterium]